jgi:hypothetical protein
MRWNKITIYMRLQILQRIIQGTNTTSKRNKTEWKIITNMQSKVRTKKLVIRKVDEGKTLIILTQEEYKQKKPKHL